MRAVAAYSGPSRPRRQRFQAVQRALHARSAKAALSQQVQGESRLLFAGPHPQQRPVPQPEPDILQDFRLRRHQHHQGEDSLCSKSAEMRHALL